MVKCDPTIKDLHDYEESNPNHKKYFCPLCAKKHSKTSNAGAGSAAQGTSVAAGSSSSTSNPSLTRKCNTNTNANANDDDVAATAVATAQLPRKKRKGNNGQASSAAAATAVVAGAAATTSAEEEGGNGVSELFGCEEDAVLDSMRYQLSHRCDNIAVEMWKEGALEGRPNANAGLPTQGQLQEIISYKMVVIKKMRAYMAPQLEYHREKTTDAKNTLETQKNDLMYACRKALVEFIDKKKRKRSANGNNSNSNTSLSSTQTSATSMTTATTLTSGASPPSLSTITRI